MNLGFSQYLNKQWRAIDQENSWEPTDSIPNITWYRLNRDNNDDILLFTLSVFGPERKYKMHNWWMNTANDDVIDKLL